MEVGLVRGDIDDDRKNGPWWSPRAAMPMCQCAAHGAQIAVCPPHYDIDPTAKLVGLRLLEVEFDHPGGLWIVECHVTPVQVQPRVETPR